jgi:hypothetical protein
MPKVNAMPTKKIRIFTPLGTLITRRKSFGLPHERRSRQYHPPRVDAPEASGQAPPHAEGKSEEEDRAYGRQSPNESAEKVFKENKAKEEKVAGDYSAPPRLIIFS